MHIATRKSPSRDEPVGGGRAVADLASTRVCVARSAFTRRSSVARSAFTRRSSVARSALTRMSVAGGILARASVALVLASLTLVACGTAADDDAPASTAWVGTMTTEGDVTTVVNEAGSVWSGPATLVEEASIGVESGDDAYMLGRVRDVAASDDRIYVVDSQVPVLRVYDWNGGWLRDLGQQGEGPGELLYPTGVGVDGRGRVWLHDQISLRIVVFSPAGEALTTLTLEGRRISGNIRSLVVTADGQGYVFDVVRPDDPAAAGTTLQQVMRPYGIDGVAGEPVELPRFDDRVGLQASGDGAIRFADVPFHPNGVTAFSPSRVVLAGHPADYRFEMLLPDGRRTVVERAWEPVAVHPDEAAAHREATVAYMRGMDPGWVWDGPEIPAAKPAYSRLVPAVSGEAWVVRPGPANRDPDCDEEELELDGEAHCWPERRIVDAFGPDGRFLGEVAVPGELAFEPQPYIRGDQVIARAEDAAGTVMVKRYRLVPPGAGS